MGKDLRGRELGKGYHQRKDGRYEVRAKINGKPIDIINKSLHELRKKFQEEKEKAENLIEYKRERITLNEWFEEWFDTYKIPQIKEQSIYPMKNRFYCSFGKYLGERRLIDITNMDIQNVINFLKRENKAHSTMRDALGRMRECMESAKNNRLISINPCFEIHVPWENKQIKRRFLSREEQTLFLKNIEHSWYKEMFYIMFLTGMRIGEVGGLMWSDVDFNKKCIHINRSLSCQYEYGNKVMRLTGPKTYNSYRDIPFMGEAEEMYRSQKKKIEDLKRALGKRWRAPEGYEDLVFVTSMGGPILRYIAEKEIKKVVQAINDQESVNAVLEQREPKIFDDLYPHAIRHTFCSRCFEVNMQPKVVQKIMGHQHYSTTIDIYTHVTERQFEEEIDKFGMAVDVSDVDMFGKTIEDEEMYEAETEQQGWMGIEM